MTDSILNFYDLLASLDVASRQEIELSGNHVTFAAGEVIYEQGSAADFAYIVDSGTVEAVTFSADGKLSRVLGVMTHGDFFGDLAILTDKPRLAMIRTREATKVLCFKHDVFIKLMKKIPDLGYFFSRNLARRLHNTSMEAHHAAYSIDLSGNLKKFDLLTIVQAVTSMGHTGELRLNNAANELLGSFFFRRGRVEQSQFAHLYGIEAIWQGFAESASEGTFNFRSVDQPPDGFPPEFKIDMDSTNLLLTGVGKRDTYQALPLTLRKMKGQLTKLTPALTWKNDENRAEAEAIWARLTDKPQSMIMLWKSMNYSAMSFLEVVMELGMTSQAELYVAPEEIED